MSVKARAQMWGAVVRNCREWIRLVSVFFPRELLPPALAYVQARPSLTGVCALLLVGQTSHCESTTCTLHVPYISCMPYMQVRPCPTVGVGDPSCHVRRTLPFLDMLWWRLAARLCDRG